jgi:hypothetical protein
MTPKIQNLEMVRGDSLSFDLNLGGLTEESITSIDFSAKKKISDENYLFHESFEHGVEKIGETTYRVTVAPEDTEDAEPGKYQYDLQLGIGAEIITPLMGTIRLIGDVTRRHHGD